MATAGQVGTALLQRALVDDGVELLDAAIANLQVAVQETSTGDVNALSWRSNLAAALLTRYERHGERQDLDTAIEQLSEVVRESATADPDLPSRLGNLGRALRDRYLVSADDRDLDEAIAMLQKAAGAANGQVLARHATNLGNALVDRFERTRDLADLTDAIGWQRTALDMDPESPTAWTNLSAAFHVRYQVRRDRTDLDDALTSAETAVTAAGPRHPDRSRYLSNVGVLRYARHVLDGEPNDLETAIALLTEAAEAEGSAGPAARAERLTALGNCHRERYLRYRDIHDLDRAIQYYRDAIDLTPERAYDRPRRLSALATAIGERPWSSEGDRLGEALRLHAEAVRVADRASPHLPQIVANQGSGLLTRFERYWELKDCTAAIECYDRAWQLAGADHPDRPVYLASLSQALRARHAATGDATDLHRAMEASRAAVAATGPEHRHRPDLCRYLSAALRSRFLWYGDPADLEEAVDWVDAALEGLPADHPDRSGAFAERATALRHHATHFGIGAQKAVDAARDALMAETDPARRADRLAHLGSALDLLEHDLDNLDEAIAVRRESCALTLPDDPQLGQRLTNLGNSLRDRVRRTGDREDLDEAHGHHLHALDIADPADPEYAILLSNLAGSFRDRYVRDNEPGDLVAALDRLRQAAELSSAPATRRFVAARTWALIASQTEQWESAEIAYPMAISLLPLAAWHGIDRAARQKLLRESGWLAADAAAIALQRGKPDDALELLERGRAVLWTQRLALATDLDRIRAAAPELAQRLQQARAVLDNVDEAEQLRPDNDARIRAAADWDDAIAELRERPDVLTPARSIVDQLAASPPPGTVVVVNVSQFGCHAILTKAGRVRSVDLNRLDLADLAANLETYLESIQSAFAPEAPAEDSSPEKGLADVLAWLWDAVASTVLDEVPPGERVWWCPTGPITYLPLHAAGQVPDRTVSSYTPTVGALVRRSAPAPASQRVLGVAVPEAPGASRLPAAPRELADLARQLHQLAEVTVLLDDQAGRVRVRQALTEHSWAHLACHVEHDLAHPDRSALLLADGRLALTQIATQDGYHAEGAYLSACQTAFGAVDLADEALHLAAALQYAGFRRVIGTLWPVRDAIARSAANRVYSALCHGGAFRPDHSAHAVGEVTRWLRNRFPNTPSIWASFVHIGPWQHIRPAISSAPSLFVCPVVWAEVVHPIG